MVQVHTQISQGQQWLQRFHHRPPTFVCVLGFTETGLIPGISAAGATPQDREFTAIADAEFLYHGPQPQPHYPLPPLTAGASPAFISRAVIQSLELPIHLFNAGLRHAPVVPCTCLGDQPAQCLTTGQALPLEQVIHLFQQGLIWGDRLARQQREGYLILSECVVGGTTTALAVLSGLGYAASGKVNSSHPTCNHEQKQILVQQGLSHAKLFPGLEEIDAFKVVAAVGDPMQPVVAGMAIAASRTCGVLLAGGTQMLAVYALLQTITAQQHLNWNPEAIAIGTTRWITEDPTSDTIGLAKLIEGVPLLATPLSFAQSNYPQLRVYEQGFVKEGVGAGGCAISAYLYQDWSTAQLVTAIEQLWEKHCRFTHLKN